MRELDPVALVPVPAKNVWAKEFYSSLNSSSLRIRLLPALLCKLGFHKWKNYGEQVMVVWREPGFLPGTKVNKKKHVFSKRSCLRCRVTEEKQFSETIDGQLEITGCVRIEASDK